MARYDMLTGLPNRFEFFSFCDNIISSGENIQFAVCTLDLDNFKDVNDIEGHDIGDKLLQETSHAALKIMGENEIVARFGGDEFVAIKSLMKEVKLQNFVKGC